MAPRTRRSTAKEIEPQNERMDPEDSDYDEEIARVSDDSELSDDSEDDDPSFDVRGKEACLRLSNLSIKTARDDDSMSDEEGPCCSEVGVPPLDVNEEKCFERVEKIINDGGVDKLKVDQCKIYLRKYGLRLTGKKDVLVGRIKEHLEVKDGGGQKLYPKSSFVLNCKGDACTGDVVMFEQNVYDMFSIVSRSATAPPCGTRLVAGRIVKESYGVAKQQHTFTIEVLWSEGVKPLPALHPLLIKGRNLYKLKTMRQRWPNEMERSSVIQEKHLRGSRARFSREARVQLKEMRKKLATSKRTKKWGGITSNQQKNVLPRLFPEIVPAAPAFTKNGPFQGNAWLASHNMNSQGGMQRPLSGPQYALPSVNSQIPQHSSCLSFLPESSGAGMYHIDTNFRSRASNVQPAENIPNLCTNQHFPSHHHRNLCGNGQQRQPLTSLNSCSQPCNQQQMNKRQLCRHFVRGSCYFGNSCKFVHDRR
ncbi:zinc finger CCCH domain-containing protein 62 [Nymphaea colorata]|nr:zinc finger CCCH domain-containing protein 62 [Nymphaea colorata]